MSSNKGYRGSYRKAFDGGGGKKIDGKRILLAWAGLVMLVLLIFSMVNSVRKHPRESKPAAAEAKNQQSPPAKPNPKLVVKATRLNLRSTPEVGNGNVAAELAEGDILEILAKRGEWYKVKDKAGHEGYVYGSDKYVEAKK